MLSINSSRLLMCVDNTIVSCYDGVCDDPDSLYMYQQLLCVSGIYVGV